MPQPAAMGNFVAWGAVEQDLSGGRGQQPTDNVTPNRAKTQVLKDFQQKRSGNGVKSFGNVQFHKNTGLFLLMQEPGRVLDQHEIIQNETPFYKSTLIRRDQLIQATSQPVSH